jgi:hypothetical protein
MLIKLFGGRITIGKDLSPYAGQTDNLYGFLQQRYCMGGRLYGSKPAKSLQKYRLRLHKSDR